MAIWQAGWKVTCTWQVPHRSIEARNEAAVEEATTHSLVSTSMSQAIDIQLVSMRTLACMEQLNPVDVSGSVTQLSVVKLCDRIHVACGPMPRECGTWPGTRLLLIIA